MVAPDGLPYLPYEELEERPHVMVDGAPRASSVLTLSHWPRSGTPDWLARDLSTEIALAWLDIAGRASSLGRATERRARALLQRARAAEAVTCDHFDEDGLISLGVMTSPGLARAHAATLVEAASCGDFGVVGSERAASIAFAIAPLADREAGAEAKDSERYGAVLPLLAELFEAPEHFAALYDEELSWFLVSRRALETGEVEITLPPAPPAAGNSLDPDLAVVTPARAPRGRAGGLRPLHRAVVHSATTCNRILLLEGQRCELYLRYESWVRYVSRPIAARPELEPLAAELSALEPGHVSWSAQHVSATEPSLRPDGEGVTELDPQAVVECVARYLVTAPPAG